MSEILNNWGDQIRCTKDHPKKLVVIAEYGRMLRLSLARTSSTFLKPKPENGTAFKESKQWLMHTANTNTLTRGKCLYCPYVGAAPAPPPPPLGRGLRILRLALNL